MKQFILNHSLGSFTNYIYNTRGICENLTFLNSTYQVKVLAGGGGDCVIKNGKNMSTSFVNDP